MWLGDQRLRKITNAEGCWERNVEMSELLLHLRIEYIYVFAPFFEYVLCVREDVEEEEGRSSPPPRGFSLSCFPLPTPDCFGHIVKLYKQINNYE